MNSNIGRKNHKEKTTWKTSAQLGDNIKMEGCGMGSCGSIPYMGNLLSSLPSVDSPDGVFPMEMLFYRRMYIVGQSQEAAVESLVDLKHKKQDVNGGKK